MRPEGTERAGLGSNVSPKGANCRGQHEPSVANVNDSDTRHRLTTYTAATPQATPASQVTYSPGDRLWDEVTTWWRHLLGVINTTQAWGPTCQPRGLQALVVFRSCGSLLILLLTTRHSQEQLMQSAEYHKRSNNAQMATKPHMRDEQQHGLTHEDKCWLIPKHGVPLQWGLSSPQEKPLMQ